MKSSHAWTAALLVLSTACSNGGRPGAEPAEASPPNLCSMPRPEICTQEYRPVCASLTDGATRTYASGCTACTDTAVTGWHPGPCD